MKSSKNEVSGNDGRKRLEISVRNSFSPLSLSLVLLLFTALRVTRRKQLIDSHGLTWKSISQKFTRKVQYASLNVFPNRWVNEYSTRFPREARAIAASFHQLILSSTIIVRPVTPIVIGRCGGFRRPGKGYFRLPHEGYSRAARPTLWAVIVHRIFAAIFRGKSWMPRTSEKNVEASLNRWARIKHPRA